MNQRLEVVPVNLSDAKVFVDRHHRHHPAPVGGLFAIGAARDGEMVGVVIVGRPVARSSDDGWTAEVTRLCVLENEPNACSLLYAAAWRACRAMGWRKLQTYTLATEPGTSLRAAGWKTVAQVKGRSWSTPSRPRIDRHPTQDKLKWEATA